MSGICARRVVVVTGAGAGLGQAYALALARAGAAVVVNDIRADAAEDTARQIADAGGEALPNDGDITCFDGADAILSAATARFGEVHAVVNNAGVCRDRMFVSMSEAEWDDVMRVHLRGHFCLSNRACARWRAQAKQGSPVAARIVNTSSGAGLQGSVGQSNYSAAKAGIAALTLVQAVELGRYGITANALVPSARTGMTTQVPEFAERMRAPADDRFDHYAPENVAPLVVWLCSPHSSHVSGRVFELEGGRVNLCDGWRSGEWADKGSRYAPEEIGAVVERLIADAPAPQPVYGAS